MAYFIPALLACFTLFAHPLHAEGVPLPANEMQWEQQKAFFNEHGYVWIKGFFSEQDLALLNRWCEQINCASQGILTLMQYDERQAQMLLQNLPGLLVVVPEASNPNIACRAEDLLTCYPELDRFITGSLTSYLSSLFEEPYVLFKDKINFKWPGGGAFLPHQDFPAYEPFRPREHVTAMVCVDAATQENGCLQVATQWKECFVNDPTIDQEALAEGRAVFPFIMGGKAHGAIQPEYVKKMHWLNLEASPGDVVIFSSFLPHYSEDNHSQTSRRAMFLTYNRLQEGDHRKAYYDAKRNDPLNPLFHIGTPTKARTK